MSPNESPLSRQALAGILDALEHKNPLSRQELSALASVSSSTASRAAGFLSQVGVLSASRRQNETHPVALSLTPLAVLPVLTLGQCHGTVQALNARLDPLGSTITELNPEQTDKERLRLLCRRAMTLLNGCTKASGLSAAAPILLTDGVPPAPKAWEEAVTDIMGVPPLAVMREDTAIARALRWEDLPQNASSLLYLRTGESPTAYLFSRSESDSWAVSPPRQTLCEALSRSLSREDSTAEGQGRGILRFIQDLNGFFPPELLVLEDPRGLFQEGNTWKEALPDGLEVIPYMPPAQDLTLPVMGAATYARRLLWEKMTGLSV